MYFTLDSEANEDPPEFTLTCQSKGGPATEVVWMRNGVRVEEDSNHTTSQIIVDTSGIIVQARRKHFGDGQAFMGGFMKSK